MDIPIQYHRMKHGEESQVSAFISSVFHQCVNGIRFVPMALRLQQVLAGNPGLARSDRGIARESGNRTERSLYSLCKITDMGNHLHHVHIFASNLSETIRFYEDFFDGKVVLDWEFAGARNVFMQIGNGRIHFYDQPPKVSGRGSIHHFQTILNKTLN